MYLINLRNYTHTYQNSTDAGRPSMPGLPAVPVHFQLSRIKNHLLTVVLAALLCAAFLCSGPVSFQGKAFAGSADEKCRTFSGTIYDLRTLDPLAGAVVSVRSGDKKGDYFETKTGDNGKYSLYDIPAGTYTVKVSREEYISDSIRLHLKKPYERYDASIESERDFARKNTPDYERNVDRYAAEEDEDYGVYGRDGAGTLEMSPAPEFSPKDNFNGVSGFFNLPDCSVMPYCAYRLSYGIQRSKRLSSPATPYVESNYSTAVGYGLAENMEMAVFAFQHFDADVKPMVVPATATTAARAVPPFYSDRTGVSLKYAGKYKYRQTSQVFPYSLLYTHYNDGSDEVAIPVEIVSQFSGKFYFIPTYISRLGGKVHFNFAYNKPLFIDHRKLSYMMEFVQNDKHRWNIINAGFRLEFKNDSAANFFLLTDSEKKRMSVGVSGTMLFK